MAVQVVLAEIQGCVGKKTAAQPRPAEA